MQSLLKPWKCEAAPARFFLDRAAEEGYATSPPRQVLPVYGQDVMLSPEVQKQIDLMRAQQQSTATGARTQVQGQPFVQGQP